MHIAVCTFAIFRYIMQPCSVDGMRAVVEAHIGDYGLLVFQFFEIVFCHVLCHSSSFD